MSRLKKFQEKQQKLSRFQALKSIFSSMLITVSAVIVGVMVIPKSPIGEITSLEAFNNAIIYTVEITDEDNAIISDTLIVRLENQSENYEIPIILGSNTGTFHDLQNDTEYTLKILADKGFGLEVLDSQKIQTYPQYGGIISKISLLTELEWGFEYEIEYIVNDQFHEYQSIQLRYGILNEWDTEIQTYSIIPLLQTENKISILDIPNNSKVYIYLEAININSETIILDEASFLTPFKLYTSIYPERISDDSVSLSMFTEGNEDLEVEYEVLLKIHDFIVARKKVEIPESSGDFHHEMINIEFDELIKEQLYQAILLAKYHDPYTKEYVEKEVSVIEFTTLPKFDSSITIREYIDYYEVSVIIDDYKNFYDQAYFTIYEVTEFGNWWNQSLTYSFEIYDNQKQITMTINKPDLTEYYIEVGIKSSNDFSYYVILDKINNFEEVS